APVLYPFSLHDALPISTTMTSWRFATTCCCRIALRRRWRLSPRSSPSGWQPGSNTTTARPTWTYLPTSHSEPGPSLPDTWIIPRSEEHTSELQSPDHLV